MPQPDPKPKKKKKKDMGMVFATYATNILLGLLFIALLFVLDEIDLLQPTIDLIMHPTHKLMKT